MRMPKKLFHLFARGRADLLDHGAAIAEDDGFLAVALHVDGGEDADQAVGFFPMIHQNDDGVRNFLARLQQDFFAHQFGGEEARGLVGDVIGGEVRRAFGKRADDQVAQAWSTSSGARAETGRKSSNVVQFAEELDGGQHLLAVLEQVDLVDDQEHGRLWSGGGR